MYFAYADESGDNGYKNSPTPSFTLAIVVVDVHDWLATLDELIAFRRGLRNDFGVAVTAELKATSLVHGKGPLRHLSRAERMEVYRRAMVLQCEIGTISTWAVVIRKDKIRSRDTVDPRDTCWEYMIQRLERFADHHESLIHLLPDEGHGLFIRKKLRKMRRFNRPKSAFGDSRLNRDALNIVEDSSDRDSSASYFIQLADLNAYAAYRTVYPCPGFGDEMWSVLDSCRDARTNRLRPGPTGIVVWP